MLNCDALVVSKKNINNSPKKSIFIKTTIYDSLPEAIPTQSMYTVLRKAIIHYDRLV